MFWNVLPNLNGQCTLPFMSKYKSLYFSVLYVVLMPAWACSDS